MPDPTAAPRHVPDAVRRLQAENADLRSKLEAAERAIEWAVRGLRAIEGPCDEAPWIDQYRAAGGGYSGLQSIAHLTLTERVLVQHTRQTVVAEGLDALVAEGSASEGG